MTELIKRAETALKEARHLLDGGFGNGAVGRAYYAIFYAAKAALRAISPELAEAKTHGTIMRRLLQHLKAVEQNGSELAPIVKRALETRHQADFGEPPMSADVAKTFIDSAETFIAVVSAFISSRTP